MRKKARAGVCKAAQMRSGAQHPFGMLSGVTALGGGETEVYRQIRNAVPILDAAIGKLVTKKLVKRDLPTDTDEYMNIDHIDPVTMKIVAKEESEDK